MSKVRGVKKPGMKRPGVKRKLGVTKLVRKFLRKVK